MYIPSVYTQDNYPLRPVSTCTCSDYAQRKTNKKTEMTHSTFDPYYDFCCAMLYASAAYVVMRCLSVRHISGSCQNE